MKQKLILLAAALAAIALTAQTNTNETANRHAPRAGQIQVVNSNGVAEWVDPPALVNTTIDTNKPMRVDANGVLESLDWPIRQEWKEDTNWDMAIIKQGEQPVYFISPQGKMLQIGKNGISNLYVYSKVGADTITNLYKTTNYALPEPLPTRWVTALLATNKDGSVTLQGWKP
jgi:hypothetical protein